MVNIQNPTFVTDWSGYLYHTSWSGRVKVDNKTADKISDSRTPVTVTELRCFLRL